MNIEGNKVIWQDDKLAVAETRYGTYLAYKQITVNDGDGTAFRSWNEISELFNDSDEAISYCKENK